MEISYNVLLSSLLSLHTFIQINGGSSSDISFLRLIDFLKFSRLTPLLEYGLLEEKDIGQNGKESCAMTIPNIQTFRDLLSLLFKTRQRDE